MIKKCKECQGTFNGKRKQVFCSKVCRGISDKKKNRSDIACDGCGTTFNKLNSQIERSEKHFCSSACRYANQGKFIKGDDNPNWKNKTTKRKCLCCGGVFSYSLYKGRGKYCSMKCKNEHQMVTLVGENNPNYKQNKPNYKRIKERQYTGYKEWRIEVFKRDNFNCVKCGRNSSKKNRLAAHHIFNHHSHPELRVDVHNGITLCFECHTDFHREYGTINNNREQLNIFLEM